MQRRNLGGVAPVTEVGLGTWNIGSDWGDVSDEEGRRAVRTALDAGANFLDTADVYGDGRSERHIGAVLDDRQAHEEVIVATKAGRRLSPHDADGYTAENLERFVDRSRDNLGEETLDLLQLHCPPTEVYYRPSVFEALADLKDRGKIDHYGVSVEKVEEALKAIAYPGVETVQIIFNPFRQRPAELLFEEARKRDIGIIVRVPLASGLLTGAIDRDTEFPENDHRNFNRDGEAFDVGETFAGVPLETGVEAVEALQPYTPEDLTLAQTTIRWILDHEAVSTVIPGSTTPSHIRENIAAAEAEPLSNRLHGVFRDVYEEHIATHVHHRW